MKPYGFFFGVGFALGNSFDQIMDLLFFAWIWIHYFSQIQIREFESDDLY